MEQENKKPRKKNKKDPLISKERIARENKRRKDLESKKQETGLSGAILEDTQETDEDPACLAIVFFPPLIEETLRDVYYDVYNDPSELKEVLQAQKTPPSEADIAEVINVIKPNVVKYGSDFVWENRQQLAKVFIDTLYYIAESYGMAKQLAVSPITDEQMKAGSLPIENKPTSEAFINILIERVTSDFTHSIKSLFNKNLTSGRPAIHFKTKQKLELAINKALNKISMSGKYPGRISKKAIALTIYNNLPEKTATRTLRRHLEHFDIDLDTHISDWITNNTQEVDSGQNKK